MLNLEASALLWRLFEILAWFIWHPFNLNFVHLKRKTYVIDGHMRIETANSTDIWPCLTTGETKPIAT